MTTIGAARPYSEARQTVALQRHDMIRRRSGDDDDDDDDDDDEDDDAGAGDDDAGAGGGDDDDDDDDDGLLMFPRTHTIPTTHRSCRFVSLVCILPPCIEETLP
eukprot:876802-Rhodomonas_salina.3